MYIVDMHTEVVHMGVCDSCGRRPQAQACVNLRMLGMRVSSRIMICRHAGAPPGVGYDNQLFAIVPNDVYQQYFRQSGNDAGMATDRSLL